MKIFSKKAFAIGEGVTQANPIGTCIVTQPGGFQTIPDSMAKDPMLQAAIAEGSIVIVDNENKSKIENDFVDNSNVKEVTPKSEEEAFYEELKLKSRDEAIKMAEDMDIKLDGTEKTGKIKSLIMNAFREEKLSEAE